MYTSSLKKVFILITLCTESDTRNDCLNGTLESIYGFSSALFRWFFSQFSHCFRNQRTLLMQTSPYRCAFRSPTVFLLAIKEMSKNLSSWKICHQKYTVSYCKHGILIIVLKKCNLQNLIINYFSVCSTWRHMKSIQSLMKLFV